MPFSLRVLHHRMRGRQGQQCLIWEKLWCKGFKLATTDLGALFKNVEIPINRQSMLFNIVQIGPKVLPTELRTIVVKII